MSDKNRYKFHVTFANDHFFKNCLPTLLHISTTLPVDPVDFFCSEAGWAEHNTQHVGGFSCEVSQFFAIFAIFCDFFFCKVSHPATEALCCARHCRWRRGWRRCWRCGPPPSCGPSTLPWTTTPSATTAPGRWPCCGTPHPAPRGPIRWPHPVAKWWLGLKVVVCAKPCRELQFMCSHIRRWM